MTTANSSKDSQQNSRLSTDDDIEEEPEENQVPGEESEDQGQEEGQEQQSPLNRQERRRLERDSEKYGREDEDESQETETDGTLESEDEQVLINRQRAPKVSSRFAGDQEEDISVLDNPGELYSEPGEDLLEGRFEQVSKTGVLDNIIGGNVFEEEQRKLNNTINAFVSWQAAQDKYFIYLNVGHDKKLGKDKWLPKIYRFNPLTTGNQLRINRLVAVIDDLRRAVNNNDTRVSNANIKLQSALEKLMKLQCQIYFRMNTEKELMIAHFNDINLMIQSAQYCSAQVPQSQKTRWLSSSSKTRQNHIR